MGTEISLEGRFQSRSYVKLTESGPEQRVAYEISAAEAALEEEAAWDARVPTALV